MFIERHYKTKTKPWGRNKKHVVLDDSIYVAKNYQKRIYFVLELGETALPGSKRFAFEYASILRYPWHLKAGVTKLDETHPRSKIIHKMVNDLFCVWKENQSSKLFRCYFHINKGHDYILLLDDVKNEDRQEKVTRDIWKDILQNLSWRGVVL